MQKRNRLMVFAAGAVFAALSILFGGDLYAQLQQSGGPGSSVTLLAGAAKVGVVTTDQTTHGTTDLVASDQIKINGVTIATGNGTVSTGVQRVAIASDNTAFAVNATLAAGTANLGFVRVLPSSCTQSTNFSNATAGVAITTGTTVTATTTCVTYAYANNITNAAVTLRLADKAGTPVIWLGGGNDFSIPANSNMRVPIEGVTFTSGITAIAGTASAINLQINGVQ